MKQMRKAKQKKILMKKTQTKKAKVKMNKTKLIFMFLFVILVSGSATADGYPELYYDQVKQVLVYNRDTEIPFTYEQNENSKNILDQLEGITEIYTQDNILHFKAENFNKEGKAQGEIIFDKNGELLEMNHYYEDGDIYKKWDYNENIYTEYYHDEFIKKTESIETGEDTTEGIEQQFGWQSEDVGEFKATYLNDEDNLNLNYMGGMVTLDRKIYENIKEELRLLVNPREVSFDENANSLTFIAEDRDTGEEYYAKIKFDEDNNIDSKNYYKDKFDDDGNYVITDITRVDKEGKITSDSQDYSPLFNSLIPSPPENIQQEIQKEEFINELNRLVEKYKEGGKEAFSNDEEELIFLKNAKNIAKNKYGIDEDELTYEQKVIIEHASQTYADIFYDSVRAARGGIALSNLLNSWLDWDFMMKWRKKSDEFFSQTVIGRIISGKWEESICHKHIDNIPNNVAVVNTNYVMGFAAHVEGERSKQITTNNKTIYFYKITFAVRPRIEEDEEIEFELLIDGNKADLDNDGKADKIELKAGETYDGTGKNAVVRYKDEIYENVCIKFYNTENLEKEFTRSLNGNKLCNKIVEAYIGPNEISKPAETATTDSGTTASDGW
jgi:hypothetical protein